MSYYRVRNRKRRNHAAADRAVWFNRWLVSTLIAAGLLCWYGNARWLPVLGAVSVTVLLVKRWMVRATVERNERALRLGSFHDDHDPGRFEERTVLLLRDLGWTDVRRTGQTGDGGVDVRGCKDGQPWIVQCKRYAATNTIGEPMIRDFYGALMHEGAAGGLFVTSSTFTAQAQRWAAGKPIVLWDAEELGHQLAATAPDVVAETHVSQRRWMYRMSALAVLVASALLISTFVPALLVRRAAQPVTAPSVMAAPTPTRAAATVLPTATPPPTLQATVIQDGNLRAQPAMNGKVLHVVRGRAHVQILGRTAEAVWVLVQVDGGARGWLHRSLLDVDASVLQELPVQS